MTVAHDAFTESATWTNTPDPFTFNHTPTGTPRGVIVLIAVNLEAGADVITGVTYGGVAMARPSPGFANDTASELGSVYAYFLGASIPTGTQTVSIDHTAGAGIKIAYCITLTAAGDTQVAVSAAISEDATNPQTALDSGSDSSLRYCIINSGHGTVSNLTLLSGMTAVESIDHGARIVRCDRQTTAGSGSFTIGYTATVEDVAFVAVAIRESSGPQTISPGGIASAEAFGTLKTLLQILPSAIASVEAHGSARLNLGLAPSAIASSEAHGAARLNLALPLSAIASAESFGSATLTQPGGAQTISPPAIVSAEAFGAPRTILFLAPSSIASAETFGSARLDLALLLSAIASAEAFGAAQVNLNLAATGISSAEALGAARLNLALAPVGLASGESFGSARLLLFVHLAGIASAEVFGLALVSTGALLIAPAGIVSAETFGAARLRLSLAPNGVASIETFGQARIRLAIAAAAIASGEAFGSASLRLMLAPIGIASAEAFGTLVISLGLFPTPARRIFYVLAQGRAAEVGSENRVIEIDLEGRVYVPKED